MNELTIDQLITELNMEKQRNGGNGDIKVIIPNDNASRFNDETKTAKNVRTIRDTKNQPQVLIN